MKHQSPPFGGKKRRTLDIGRWAMILEARQGALLDLGRMCAKAFDVSGHAGRCQRHIDEALSLVAGQ